MAELKPCPFCGKPAKTTVNSADGYFVLKAMCSGCCYVMQTDRIGFQCSFEEIRNKMDIVESAWNRRIDNGN